MPSYGTCYLSFFPSKNGGLPAWLVSCLLAVIFIMDTLFTGEVPKEIVDSVFNYGYPKTQRTTGTVLYCVVVVGTHDRLSS
eukprot:g82504.t1